MRRAIVALAFFVAVAPSRSSAVEMQLVSSYVDGTSLVLTYDDPDVTTAGCTDCTILSGQIVPGFTPLGNSFGGYLLDDDPDPFSVALDDVLANDFVSTLTLDYILADDLAGPSPTEDWYEFEFALANGNVPLGGLLDELIVTESQLTGTNRAVGETTSFAFDGFPGQSGNGVTRISAVGEPVPAPVPEPGAAAVFAVGLAASAVRLRKGHRAPR